METKTIKKNLTYKRATTTTPGVTLQEYLNLAVKKLPKAASRMEKLSEQENIHLVLNLTKTYHGMFFGELILFAAGRDQQLIKVDDAAPVFDLNKLLAPKATDGKKQEFLDSILYFGVYADHVVVLQSSALRARNLENYLGWLLGQKAKVLPTDSYLVLNDKPSEAVFKKLEKTPVRSVSIGTPIAGEVAVDDEEEVDDNVRHQAKSLTYTPTGKGFDIVASLLGENWLRENLKDALDESNLQVKLEISYFRKTTKKGQKILDSVATSLRNLEPEDVEIKLQGGGRIKGTELKLSGDVQIDVINGVYVTDVLCQAMHTWIMSKIAQAEIEAPKAKK